MCGAPIRERRGPDAWGRLGPRRLLLTAALLLAAACGEEDPGAGGEAVAAGGRGDSVPSAGLPSPSGQEAPASPPFHPVTPVRPPDFYGQERGAGVVFFRDAFLGGPSGSDTITVLAAPDPRSDPVARFRLQRDSFTWDYVLEAREAAAEGAVLEYGYEEWGLPVLARRGDVGGPWMQVRYATGPSGEALTGWVNFDPARLDFLSWTERLAEVPLYFLDPDSVRFFEAPEGTAVEVPLAEDGSDRRFDYVLNPLESRGPWMRVEVVTPSNYCADPPTPRRDTLWIHHLDEAGRPRVWYYTRGC